MTLREGEYQIADDSITIRKEVLEQCRDHFNEVAREQHGKKNELLSMYYNGKADVFTDLLKMFEPLEG